MPIISFPCTISCSGGGGAPSPKISRFLEPAGFQQRLSRDKSTKTDQGGIGSSVSHLIHPSRERVESPILTDYQTAANLFSNSSKSFGLISSELLPFTVQSTPSLS